MPPHFRPLTLPNIFDLAQKPESIVWSRFRDGVDIHWLYETAPPGPAAALIRFHPGARVELHQHTGFEHILLLAGSQTDENGQHSRGALIIHPPGTRHSIASAEGCVVLAIYEKPVVFG